MAGKLQKAIEALHKEIGKLDPKPRTAIQGHIATIRGELQKRLGDVVNLGGVNDPNWSGDSPAGESTKKR
jgi:hypothetical protein